MPSPLSAHLYSRYIVTQRYVHRDIATRNCLLHTNNLVKISDFGLAAPWEPGKDYFFMRQSGAALAQPVAA